jgi:hypothetical protein
MTHEMTRGSLVIPGPDDHVFNCQTAWASSVARIFFGAGYAVVSSVPPSRRGRWRARWRNHCSFYPRSLSRDAGASSRAIAGVFLTAPGRALRVPSVSPVGLRVLGAFGFAAINSMQQARLVAAAPDLASASVALNTSVLYVGQAVGSGIGGLLFAQEYFHLVGYVGVAFVALACVLLAATWERAKRRQS